VIGECVIGSEAV
jgi:hypothetical protein